MAKKGSSSSKKASQTPEKIIVVKKGQPCSTIKKPGSERKIEDLKTFGSEIDEIFSTKKRKKPETEENVAANKAAISKTKQRKISRAKSKPNKEIKVPLDMTDGPRKRTNDGLVVYTEEELGFGKADAGGTRLCPFDCDCCF